MMAIIDTLFMTKTAENHTLWGRTYLYSPYKGVPPPPGIKPFSAKLLSAFENEKITVNAEETILQIVSRGNEHISLNSVSI